MFLFVTIYDDDDACKRLRACFGMEIAPKSGMGHDRFVALDFFFSNLRGHHSIAESSNQSDRKSIL